MSLLANCLFVSIILLHLSFDLYFISFVIIIFSISYIVLLVKHISTHNQLIILPSPNVKQNNDSWVWEVITKIKRVFPQSENIKKENRLFYNKQKKRQCERKHKISSTKKT